MGLIAITSRWQSSCQNGTQNRKLSRGQTGDLRGAMMDLQVAYSVRIANSRSGDDEGRFGWTICRTVDGQMPGRSGWSVVCNYWPSLV